MTAHTSKDFQAGEAMPIAAALPIARAFLNCGGRLMISPEGELEARMDLERIFGSNSDSKDARRCFVVGRRLSRRLNNPRFASSVKCLVLMDGKQWDNGWIVAAGEA